MRGSYCLEFQRWELGWCLPCPAPPPTSPMCICLFPPERETQADPSQKPANTCEKSKDKKRGVGEKENGHWVHEWRQGAGAGRGRHRGHSAQRVRRVALPDPSLSLPTLLWLPWQVAQPLFWLRASRELACSPGHRRTAVLTNTRGLRGRHPHEAVHPLGGPPRWHPGTRIFPGSTHLIPHFHSFQSFTLRRAKKRSPFHTAPRSFSFG